MIFCVCVLLLQKQTLIVQDANELGREPGCTAPGWRRGCCCWSLVQTWMPPPQCSESKELCSGGYLVPRALQCVNLGGDYQVLSVAGDAGCCASETERHLRFSSGHRALPCLGMGDCIVHTQLGMSH